MAQPHDKLERSVLKIIFWTVAIIILLSVGGAVGFREYRKWQERRILAQANALLKEGDYKRALLGAKRVMQFNSGSAGAMRIMARLAELAGTRSAVDWRRQIVDRPSATPDDWLALARATIRFDDLATADLAISKLPAEARQSAEYHAVMAELAFVRRDLNEAERELKEALQRDPENKTYRLRLAVLYLDSPNYGLREEGRRALLDLQSELTTRRDATRKLIEDSLRLGDNSEAAVLARRMESYEEKNFFDRLLVLTALRAARDPASENLISELTGAAKENAEFIGALIAWWNTNRTPSAAVEWSKTLKPDLLVQRGVPLALADSYIAIRDWEGLQRFVKNANWGPLDAVRLALYSLALRELGNTSDAATQWTEAIKKIGPHVDEAFRLAEIAEKWGWRNETIELLWLATKDSNKGDLALQSLYRYYAQNGDTHGLYRVILRREEMHPQDRKIQNNFAQLSLLLNLNVDRGQKLARELYEAEPANAAYVSTYAFALYTQGELEKARRVFSALSEEQLRQPDIAAYYGIVLAAAGDRGKAAEYLDLGDKATLLPEEKALLDKARRMITQS